jgi:hypothetical protein
MDSKQNESPVSDLKRIMIRKFKVLKEDLKENM